MRALRHDIPAEKLTMKYLAVVLTRILKLALVGSVTGAIFSMLISVAVYTAFFVLSLQLVLYC